MLIFNYLINVRMPAGLFFMQRSFGGIGFHMAGAAFHHVAAFLHTAAFHDTVVRITSGMFGTHFFVHALFTARSTHHPGPAFLHHHLMMEIGMTITSMMF